MKKIIKFMLEFLYMRKTVDVDNPGRAAIDLETARPIILKPQIKDLLNERITPLMGGPHVQDFVLYVYGATTLEVLKAMLIFYLNIYGDVPDKLFSLLYDDLNLILEDAAIPLEQLTQDQKNLLLDPVLPSRIDQEFQGFDLHDTVHTPRRYDHLFH